MRIPLVLALLAAALAAQTPPRPTFEVATLKRNSPNCQLDPTRGASPGRLDLACFSMRAFIRMAYSMYTGNTMMTRRVEALGGPSWLDNERYDLSAKAAGPASAPEMIGPMLQMLLEERLQLKVHTEPRETAVFELTAPSAKTKLQPVAEGSCTPIDIMKPFRPGDKTRYCGGGGPRTDASGMTVADWTGISMDELAGRMLSSIVARPVVNRTGLDGRYDVRVEFVWPRTSGAILNGQPAALPESDSSAGPSIFTALQSVGLKLTPAKAPLDVIVIDRVERPSEN